MSGLGRRAARIFSVTVVAALVLGTVAIQPASGAITYNLVLDDAFTWSSGGNASWTTVLPSASAADGVDCAKSGVIGNSASTWVEAVVTGPGTLTWWAKTSCEPSWDKLIFSAGGEERPEYTLSGVTAWTKQTLELAADTYTLRWTYAKDGSVASADDAAYLDQVRFNETPVALTDGAHLAASETRLFPTGISAGDQTGQSVAISDDTMASGAPWDDTGAVDAGSVAIYKRIDGYWTQYQLLTASDEIASAHFGTSVAMDGDYLSVGAYSREKIYAYIDNGVQFVPLGAPIPAPVSNVAFGGAIAQSGTTLVAGCRAYGGYAGRVYVYVYDGGWVLQQAIDAPDGGVNQEFGSSVQIDGNRIIVGAPYHDHPGAPGGAAYVFDRSGTTWSLTTELTDPNGQDGDKLGSAVAVSGDTAVVGETVKFKVDVFTVEDGWHMTDVLEPPTKQALSNFGLHVAIDGDTILAGDGFYDGSSKGGAVFAYQRSNGLFFDRVETIQPAVGESFPAYGDAIDIDGAQFAVGARVFDGTAGGSQGASYVYDGAYYRVAEGGSLSIPAERGLLANDIDTAADILNVWVASGTTSGSMITYLNGQFTYDTEVDGPAEVPFTYRATDGVAGSNEAAGYITVAPSPSGTIAYNYGNYYTNNADVDASLALLNAHQYRTQVDGGSWSSWAWLSGSSMALSLPAGDGEHSVSVEARGSGGSTWFNDTVYLDTVKPVVDRDDIALLAPGDSVHVTATDVGGSGVKRIGYTIDGGSVVYVTGDSAYIPFASAGSFDVEYWAEDNASNSSTVAAETFTVVQPEATYSRFSGTDRYATAILASRSAFADGGCSAVVIATGLNYPDALSGAGLGGAANAPVLLVGGDVLRSDVKAEIQRLTQGHATYKIYILGSTAAVTAKMETSIKASLTGESVERFSGTNRYHTAQLVAAKVKALQGASFGNKAILVTGLDYVDGLLVGPAAFAAKAPILLVNTTADAGLKSTLNALGTKDLVVLGTAARIPTAVETSLKSAVPGLTTRRASNLTDTYARSAAAAEYFANPANGFGLTWAGLGIATAEKFPDGLGAGCVEGAFGTSLLLTKTASLPSVISAKIAEHDTQIGTVRFYGSAAAVSGAVETSVRNLLP